MTACRTFLSAISLFLTALLSGCASYQLGSHSELPFESIYIRPASNASFAPQSQAILSAQVRDAFIKDGRVKLLSHQSEADAILEISIIEYTRQSGARRRSDTETAQTFRVGLEAEISLLNANTGALYFEQRKLEEHEGIYVDNPYANTAAEKQGYIRAEYNAMPRITRGLARKIADEVLSPWPTRDQAIKAKPLGVKMPAPAEATE